MTNEFLLVMLFALPSGQLTIGHKVVPTREECFRVADEALVAARRDPTGTKIRVSCQLLLGRDPDAVAASTARIMQETKKPSN